MRAPRSLNRTEARIDRAAVSPQSRATSSIARPISTRSRTRSRSPIWTIGRASRAKKNGPLAAPPSGSSATNARLTTLDQRRKADSENRRALDGKATKTLRSGAPIAGDAENQGSPVCVKSRWTEVISSIRNVLRISFYISRMLALFTHTKIPGHFSPTNAGTDSSASGDSTVGASDVPASTFNRRSLPAASMATVLVEAAAWTAKSCALIRGASYISSIANRSKSTGAQVEVLPTEVGKERK